VTDPKQALTKLRREHAFALRTTSTNRLEGFDELGFDELGFDELGAGYSITTVEELIALSRVGDDLLDRVGIAPTAVAELTEHYGATPAGERELASWARYHDLAYATGCAPNLGARSTDAPVRPKRPRSVPPSVSLIDEHMSPIRDQAQRGTCTAFAALACLEYHEHRVAGHRGIDLSEQFAYWNMVEHAAHHDLLSMFMGLRNDGACVEQAWPYVPNELLGNDGEGPPPPDAVAEAHDHRAGTVSQLAARDVVGIKHSVAAFRPVAIGIPVYDSWFASAVVRKYGNITVPLPGEEPQPIGHAVALVGFADDEQFAGGGYFLVRNSWDGQWGTESVFGPGYGTIPYRYVAEFNWDAWCVSSTP
jgi:papain like protease